MKDWLQKRISVKWQDPGAQPTQRECEHKTLKTEQDWQQGLTPRQTKLENCPFPVDDWGQGKNTFDYTYS